MQLNQSDSQQRIKNTQKKDKDKTSFDYVIPFDSIEDA